MRLKGSESHNTRSSNHPRPINAGAFSDDTLHRFHAKYQRRGDHECWFWASNKQLNGYGTFTVGNRPVKAHRIAYELAYGLIPDGMSILHRCDQPDCVNPAHLFVGDHTANMRDAANKRRLSVPRPNKQRLTDAQCDEIVALVAAGAKQLDVARDFGVSRTLVSLLANGKRRQLRPSFQKTA